MRPTVSHLSGSTFVFYKWVVRWGWPGTQSAPAASSPERLPNVPNRVLLCWNLEHLRGKPTSLNVWRVLYVTSVYGSKFSLLSSIVQALLT